MMTKSDFDALTIKRFTFDGLNCLIQKMDLGSPAMAVERSMFSDLGMESIHLCGYVGLPKGHPFYGVKYSQKLPFTLEEAVGEDEPMGDRGILPMVCRSFDGCTSMDCLVNVHGSVTYTDFCEWRDGSLGQKLWWVGFDCAHSGDRYARCNEAFVENQIKQMVWDFQKHSKIMTDTKDRPMPVEDDEDCDMEVLDTVDVVIEEGEAEDEA
jgi:hypothetical protein